MPRQQVYGKKSSRAACTNFAIFDSPQRSSVHSRSEESTEQLVQKVTGLSLQDDTKDVEIVRRRTALGERHANSVLSPVQTGKRQPGRRKKDVQVHKEDVVAVDEVVVLQAKVEDACPVPVSTAVVAEVFVEAGERREDVVDTQPSLKAQYEGTEALPTVDSTQEQETFDSFRVERSAAPQPSPLLYTPDPLDATPATVSARNVYATHCRQLIELSSHDLTDYTFWSTQLANHFILTKIAEASFGEVYRLSLLQPLPGLSRSDESVFKIIALQPPPSTLPTAKKARAAALRTAEAMSNPEDVASEVRVLQRMSTIPGFTNFRDVRIVQGRPPPPFVAAFEQYNVEQKAKKKDLSHFPDPGKKASYAEDQLWAVIEMQDAGTDLERLVETKPDNSVPSGCESVWAVWDIFWQVVLTLAKGEEGAEFEHRDLHAGNICVRQRPSRSRPDTSTPINPNKKLGFTNLETTIIDYTISRCRLTTSAPNNVPQVHAHPEQDIAYHDLLPDPSLFQGDSTEEYQYDIYRYMRGAVYASDPLSNATEPKSAESHNPAQDSARIWRGYHPVTNVVWLHFILYTLLEQLAWPSTQRAPARKARNGELFAQWKRASDLEHKLLRVQTLLDPEKGICKNGLRCAGDLVGLALGEGWLDERDVVGLGDDCGEDEGDEGQDGTCVVVGSSPPVSATDVPSSELGLPTHVVVDVDVMEEYGLEVAIEEARREQKGRGGRRKG
ncbi:hypothetical protein LTR62_003845 [Meristemomyces frigidus]|uniref:non-specific serine/threonine protein kinase n=1 Tax=Meristemomyces frigidus TaxID=1508187 RepID=A0AAN7TRC8_9PEZI|nr:hypothetical protein LTR62_003845 [Meristemomyces frigidus]